MTSEWRKVIDDMRDAMVGIIISLGIVGIIYIIRIVRDFLSTWVVA